MKKMILTGVLAAALAASIGSANAGNLKGAPVDALQAVFQKTAYQTGCSFKADLSGIDTTKDYGKMVGFYRCKSAAGAIATSGNIKPNTQNLASGECIPAKNTGLEKMMNFVFQRKGGALECGSGKKDVAFRYAYAIKHYNTN